MTTIADQIARAISKFEKDLLPKAAMVCKSEEDQRLLKMRLGELKKLHGMALEPPVFSIRFLGDTQNGKSTLVNVLLGRKVLPEGHVGACSATIVRCRFVEQPKITIRFRYTSEEQFLTDLAQKTADAEVALAEDGSEADKRETACKLLGRFLKLLQVEESSITDPREMISTCRDLALHFEERALLGTEEYIEVNAETEDRIRENLSARGRRAFIVDECLIEGNFPDWHPAMELVDMPGTNAFNPWDDQVNARLKQKVGGLAIVTKETQFHETVMGWFKESSILPEVAGSSERNQVRVFMIKTFVDQLNLPEDEERSKWELTQNYCREIQTHLKSQIRALVTQRFSAENEIKVLNDFVEGMPVHFVCPKVYRNLADEGLKKKVVADPLKHLDLAGGFARFDHDPNNTGIPELKRVLQEKTEEFILNHFLKKLQLEYGKEVGHTARFFRDKRVGLEQRLADQGAFVLEVDKELQGGLGPIFKRGRREAERKIVELKNHFDEEIGDLLQQVTKDFGKKTRKQLDQWLQLHWASLRCAGRKSGQHITSRGYEIDFNGNLADFCVEALNSSWISYRTRLKKLLYDELVIHFLPEIEKVIAQAKGQDKKRQKLIESTYEEVATSARSELDLQVERFESETAGFDALRPTLTEQIRKFMQPTYEGIAAEAGRGSAHRMRNHLDNGVSSSTTEIGPMVKKVVRKNWEGLTGSVEMRVNEFFDSLESQFKAQGKQLRQIAEHPSEGDEKCVEALAGLEKMVGSWSLKGVK